MDRQEQLLRAWHPRFFDVSDPPQKTDTIFLDFLRGTQRNHADKIEEWKQGFLSWHPVNEQRTPEAIKAWADDVPWTSDEYGKEYAAIAVRLAITLHIEAEKAASKARLDKLSGRANDVAEEQRKEAAINAVRDRIYGRQKALAIYDGDLTRARRHYRVDQGWHDILDQLVTDLSKIPTAGFFSAGQKWGGLNIGFVCDDAFRAAAEAVTEVACQKAFITCEICGRPGEVRKQGWWKVLCDKHREMRSIREHLQARFPSLVDRDTKINIRGSWAKYPWLWCEQVEAMELSGKLTGTRIRLHDVYERNGEIIIDYDTMPPVVDGQMSASDPRVLLRIRHIAEEIALDSRLESKE